MLGNLPESLRKPNPILSQVIQIEFTIQALEKFDKADYENLFQLLKNNVAELRAIVEKGVANGRVR